MSHPGLNNRTFTQELKEQLDQLVQQSNSTKIIADEAAHVLLRTKTENDGVKTFTMLTSAHPNDKILYHAATNTVVLSTQNFNL